MFIDKELAEGRLNDPNNVLNRIFNRNKTTEVVNDQIKDEVIPEVVPEVEVDSNPDTAQEQDKVDTVEDLTSVNPNEAMDYLLGLRTSKESTDPTTIPTTSAVVPWNSHGRAKDVPNMTTETRIVMSSLAALGEKQTDIAKAFGTSNNPVHRAVNGKTKDADKVRAAVTGKLSKVVDTALDKMISAVEAIDEHEIEQLKVMDKASLAGQLSKVVSNLNPKDEHSNTVQAQLIIYAPTQVNESRYEVVEVDTV